MKANDKIIDRTLACQVLMVGVYYKNNAPGGMASVVQYYEPYFDGLNYIASWKSQKKLAMAGRWGAGLLKAFGRLLFDRRIKVVHIHFAADGSFWRKSQFMKLAKMMGKRVVMHCHASRFKDFYAESRRKDEIRRNLAMADRLIVLSQSWKEWFEGIGIDGGRIEVLHNITAYPVKGERVDDGKMHFLFLGELGPRKGVFELLQAVADRKSELEGRMELRIGGNNNEKKLLDFIAANGLESFVKFEGWVAGEKKRALLNWADVYVLPSHNEGLPIGILEAMSYGCAVISTPVGGIPEVVHPGVNGWLVEPGNLDEIGGALRAAVADAQGVAAMGERNAADVESYLPGAVMTHLRSIYESLL